MEQKKGAGRIAKWDNARWILITLVVICQQACFQRKQ